MVKNKDPGARTPIGASGNFSAHMSGGGPIFFFYHNFYYFYLGAHAKI